MGRVGSVEVGDGAGEGKRGAEDERSGVGKRGMEAGGGTGEGKRGVEAGEGCGVGRRGVGGGWEKELVEVERGLEAGERRGVGNRGVEEGEDEEWTRVGCGMAGAGAPSRCVTSMVPSFCLPIWFMWRPCRVKCFLERLLRSTSVTCVPLKCCLI